ncbi:MAG TPA: NUDIX domain-containing protein, partial [Pilimelia sp.]|nr:NUDIX domain-containing protein [Pilimelia sp.]
MERRQKVVAYIVRDGRLLVFVHADDQHFDQSGLQVPAGTVRDGEPPKDAVLREAFEETSLAGLRVERYL